MGDSAAGLPIFLLWNGRVRKADWKGSTWEDLVALFIYQFFTRDGIVYHKRDIPARAFYLRDQTHGIFFEGFKLSEIYAGAVIEVNHPPPSDGPTTTVNEVPRNGASGKPLSKPKSMASTAVTVARIQSKVMKRKKAAHWSQRSIVWAGRTRRETIWELLDEPASSFPAALLTMFTLSLILLSTITFMVETLPAFYDHEQPRDSVWYTLEAFCISVFSLECIARLSCCPSISDYFQDTMNVIDILAITPFFVEAALAGLEIPGLAVFRVVRLVRVFRLFKVSRGSIAVFSITLHRSAKPLYMLIFFTSIAMVLSSSLMYYAERGKYDEARGAWTRLSHYECRITVRTSAPTKVDANHSIASGNPDVPCRFDSQGDSEYVAYFICPYTFARTDECDKIYEVSPFSSIPGTFWWCLVTMTTVGYGDVYPTQWVGKMVGMIVFMMGILVIALPITLIGSNFSSVYQKLVLDAETPVDDEDPVAPASQQNLEK